MGIFACTLARAGRNADVTEICVRLCEAAVKSPYVSPMALMTAWVACGDAEGAPAGAEQIAEDRSPAIFWLVDKPLFDPFRHLPRVFRPARTYRAARAITIDFMPLAPGPRPGPYEI